MTSQEPARPPTAWADPDPRISGLWGFVLQTAAVFDSELRKVARDPAEVFTRSVQPILWLVVFGQVFGRMHAMPAHGGSYVAFLAPGILAQSVLFSAIFYGIAILWERDLGILQKLLVSPAYRSALVTGKALTGAVRAALQSVVVTLVSALLGVPLTHNPLSVLGAIAAVMLGAALFATFSLSVACIVKTRERFMGIGQVLTMPLFFASNAIYPVDLMPPWLRAVARVNPLSYLVDALRALMLSGGHSVFGLGIDFTVLGCVLVALIALAARLYPSVVT